MISISEMLAPVTTEQQLEKFLASLEAVGVRARSWREGGSLRTILRVVAAAFAGFSTSVLGFVQAGFLETSTGFWLTLLAYYVYGVTRIPASFAVGEVTLINAGGGVFHWEIDELRVISSVNGKAYKNTAVVDLNPGETLTGVSVIAVEIGSDSSAPPATVTSLETPLPGVSVTNPAAIVGADEEADADLRDRSKNRLAVISGKGPRGAYAFAVKSAVRGDGSPVNVNRLRISPSSSTGIVTVYVASPTGAPESTDLPFIEESIELYARPDTVTVDLIAATPVALSRTLIVWARTEPGLTAEGLAALVNEALIEMISTYPISGIAKPPSTQGYLYEDGVKGAVKSAHAAIFDVDGMDTDIAIADGEVATFAATLDVRLIEVST